jgi:hypothetical protein
LLILREDPPTFLLKLHHLPGFIPRSKPIPIARRFLSDMKDVPPRPFGCFRVALLPRVPLRGSRHAFRLAEQDGKNGRARIRGSLDMIHRDDDLTLIGRT